MTVEYEDIFDEVWEEWLCQEMDDEEFDTQVENFVSNFVSGPDLDCLNKRKDDRTYGQFFRQIKLKTEKQNDLIRAWINSMSDRSHVVKVRNNGVDNTGKPILHVDRLSKNADFLVSIDNSPFMDVELKETANDSSLILKVSDIEYFLSKDANILFFWNTGRRKGKSLKAINKNAKWALFGSKTLKSMLTWPFKKYEKANGRKLSVKIDPPYYNFLFEVYELSGKTTPFLGISNRFVSYEELV